MKKLIIIALAITVSSCGTKKAVSESGASEPISSSKVIDSHYKLKQDFTTVYIKAGVKYKDEKQSPPNVSAEIRIKKDEQILVSVRFLGITMAKALVTPTEVKYYEKLGNKYFEGNYSTLSKWLGTDLDFQKVQNMLLGEAMDDLKKGKYKNTIEQELYRLEDASGKATAKSFFFEASKFLIKKQEITQAKEDRTLQVNYPSHKEYPEAILPAEIVIEAIQKGKKTNMNIDYNAATFNENLTFPYSVPDGYERIYID